MHAAGAERAVPAGAGIRTAAAAEMLGVSPSTLRTWERRLGFPKPRRSEGNQRQYDLEEVEALRDALQESGSISSAVEIARRRGRTPSSPPRLLAAFERFDETGAERELEESLALRSVERTIEEVLLPAVDAAGGRPGGADVLDYAVRWAMAWLHGARRLAPPASRSEGVLLLDSGSGASVATVYAEALELFLRRAGLRTLLVPARMAERRLQVALRALSPVAVVICGDAAELDVLGGPLRKAMRGGVARPYAYAGAQLVSGREGIPELGERPGQATAALLRALGIS